MDISTPRSPLLAIAVAFATGIAWDLHRPIPGHLALALAAASGLAWHHWREQRRPATACLLLTMVFFGAYRQHAARSLTATDALARLITSDRQLVQLDGVIIATPQIRPPPPRSPSHHKPTTRTKLRVESIRRCGVPQPITGHLRVTIRDATTELVMGDRTTMTGWLERPPPARNPGGWDTRQSLSRQGIHGILLVKSALSITVHGPSTRMADRFSRFQSHLRHSGSRMLSRHLSPRAATIAAAMLLGVREELDRDLREMFMRSGTIHLLAISGLHVGLLASLVWVLARLLRFGSFTTTAAIVVAVVGYALVAELRPSVLRATILVIIGVVGRPHHRRASAANSLALAALVILVIRPGDLQSPGAQLSFLAVSALVWSAPLASRLVPISGAHSMLGRMARRTFQAWLVGVAIWSVTAPLVAARFGLVAPVGLLVNVLMIPLVGLALWLGFVLLALGGWLPTAGWAIGGLLDHLLITVLTIAEKSASSPLAFVAIPAPPSAWLWLFYSLLAVLVTCHRQRLRSLCLVGIAATLTGGLATAFAPPQPNRLVLTVLDSGHGGAILLECPNRSVLLFDAGTLGDSRRLGETIRRALWHRRHRRIDALVISHADRDHFSSATWLIGRFPTGSLVTSSEFLDDQQPETLDLCANASRVGASVELVVAGDRLILDPDVLIRVRHPPDDFHGSTDNSNSVVLEITYAGRRILLTGDLEDKGQQQLLGSPTLPLDVILAPHHGSPRANTPEWASWSQPSWVIVSGGRDSTTDALRQCYGPGPVILSTRGHGAVSVTVSDNGRLSVTTAISTSRFPGTP